MIQTVFLLPGQGCYAPGVFAGQYAPELTDVLDTVDRVAAEFGRPPVSGLLRRPDAPGCRRARPQRFVRPAARHLRRRARLVPAGGSEQPSGRAGRAQHG